ncbi:hypothetical protein B0H13DRAFT_2271912 [Mycena leptocephala]|nr:hypothetical protein B0H13DRAFT_2271912 [Mycena leptocephala]
MSVAELQLEARIAQLSVDIDLQREVLKHLERAKGAAQRQLNAIRDPIARLPLEISSEIFLQCLSPYWQREPDPRQAPMLLLNVCNTWTDIALSTPALWATIHLSFHGLEISETWLQRARNFPLTINLRRSLDNHLASTLCRHANQLKHLEIHEETLRRGSLKGLGTFPILETLTISTVADDYEWLSHFSLREIIKILRVAPNLVECTFHDVTTILDYAGEKLLLPRLRSLSFGEQEDLRSLNGDDEILLHLSLPSLETLFLPLSEISSTEFSLFLMSSSPPLKKLVLGEGCDSPSMNSIQLNECLHLIPSLEHLELYARRSPFLVDLFAALADSSSHFLPHLNTLKIQHDAALSVSSYQALLRALSVRRARLVYFDLRNPDEEQLKPGPDICAGLRQIAAGGMEIYIGTQNTNFISL